MPRAKRQGTGSGVDIRKVTTSLSHLLICEDEGGHRAPFLSRLWEGNELCCDLCCDGQAQMGRAIAGPDYDNECSILCNPVFDLCLKPIEMRSPLVTKEKNEAQTLSL